MHLSGFPYELLGLMLAYADVSHLSIRLWKCGDKSLNSKLASGVTHVELRLLNGINPKIPRVLSEFHALRHVTLYSARNFTEDWPSVITALPSSLKSLKIDCQDSSQAFALDDSEGQQVLLERGSSTWKDISQFFPELHALSINRYVAASNIAASLPSTLTTFHLGGSGMRFPLVAKLPRDIQRLSVNVNTTWAKPHYSDAIMDPILDDLTLHMPKNLAAFAPRVISDSSDKVLLAISKLPEGIELLFLDFFCSPSLISALPRSLVALEMVTVDVDLSSFMAPATLPGGVQTTVGACCWPPALQSLKIALRAVSLGVIAALPPTLRQLTIESRFEDDGTNRFYANELPPRLESLELYNVEQPVALTTHGSFPASLTTLLMWDKIFDAASLSALPSTLTEIQYFHFDLPTTENDATPITFPQNAKKIRLRSWTPEWNEHIPRSVTALDLGMLMCDENHADPLAGLPTSLTKLELRIAGSKLPLVEARTVPLPISHLPLLTSLSLRTAVPSSLLKDLPRNMTELEVNLGQADESDLAFFPPNLTLLNLTGDFFKVDRLAVAEQWPLRATAYLPHTHKQAVGDDLPQPEFVARVLQRARESYANY